jgi:glycosyltransferase involved in cell wall biosynthesis
MKQNLIYIFPSYSTFVKKDIDFLSEDYNVLIPNHNWLDKKLTPLRFVQQFYFLIKNLNSCKAIFVMFGGYWSFLPSFIGKIFNVPVYIILGGTDCVSFPNLHYGSLRKPVLKYFIKWSYKLCDTLLPVDESLVYCNYTYSDLSLYNHQGYKYFFPNITTPYKVIYNGFDTILFSDENYNKIPNSFICVASISSMMRFELKGIDKMLELANTHKNCSFTVVGVADSVVNLLGDIPINVHFFPVMTQEKFKQYLLQSEFVLQLSISEGFPNALCEAMLCKCIPIGSSVGAIPLIIADCGFVMESSNSEYLHLRFREILQLNSESKQNLANKARDRIVANFDISKRKQSFKDILHS